MLGETREETSRPFLKAGAVFVAGLFLLLSAGLGLRLLGGEEPAVAAGDPSSGPEVVVMGVDSPWSGDEQASVEDAPEPSSLAAGEQAFAEGRTLDAFEIFSRYVEHHPRSVRGHYMVGLAALRTGLLEEAELGFKAALARDPGHVSSRLELARLSLDGGRPGEALDYVAAVVREHPRSAEAQRVLGRVHHNLGYFDAAATAYRRAIALDPEDAWSMNNLGYLYIEQGRFDDAIPPLARAVQIAPHVPRFQNNLGVALERLGRYRGAEAAYRAALDAEPSSARSSINLARVAGRPEAPGLEPMDLDLRAAQFEAHTLELTAGDGMLSVPVVAEDPLAVPVPTSAPPETVAP
jgi:Flp pilus assembly protein TadD